MSGLRTASGTISTHAERLQIRKQTSQVEIVVKSLAFFNTQFKVKESFLLAIKFFTCYKT